VEKTLQLLLKLLLPLRGVLYRRSCWAEVRVVEFRQPRGIESAQHLRRTIEEVASLWHPTDRSIFAARLRQSSLRGREKAFAGTCARVTALRYDRLLLFSMSLDSFGEDLFSCSTYRSVPVSTPSQQIGVTSIDVMMKPTTATNDYLNIHPNCPTFKYTKSMTLVCLWSLHRLGKPNIFALVA
jgi:hypothetical protein